MKTESIEYEVDGIFFRGYAAHLASGKKRPAILICPTWFGPDDFARQRAEMVADMGCVGFTVDMYGEGKVAASAEEAAKFRDPLMNDRNLIRKRLFAAIEAAKKIPYVHAKYIGVMGYCFGGTCALEIARAGSDVRAVVSFHGFLDRDRKLESQPIKASILAFHGHEDPKVSQQSIIDFQTEMTQAKADWQMVIFGNTMHGFTNPKAQSPEKGLQFNKLSADRSWKMMRRFFRDRFEDDLTIPQAPLLA